VLFAGRPDPTKESSGKTGAGLYSLDALPVANQHTNCYRFCALGSRTEMHNEDTGLCEHSAADISASVACGELDWFPTLCAASDPAVKSAITTTCD